MNTTQKKYNSDQEARDTITCYLDRRIVPGSLATITNKAIAKTVKLYKSKIGLPEKPGERWWSTEIRSFSKGDYLMYLGIVDNSVFFLYEEEVYYTFAARKHTAMFTPAHSTE